MESKWEVGIWSPGNHCVIEWTALPEPPFFAAKYRKVAAVYDQADVPKLAAAPEMHQFGTEVVEIMRRIAGMFGVPYSLREELEEQIEKWEKIERKAHGENE